MADNVNKPVPSDLTIPLNYVALKPGVYKVRQPLIKESGYTTDEMRYYQVPTGMALGVGNEESAVFIYRQGTIEIVGTVYHGRRLVKPGIYSVFEKLRYLNDDSEVIPFDDSTPHYRRTPYNQTLRMANDYVRQYKNAKTNNIIEYVYVDFDKQITTKQDDKLYPIPILNGKLRIYSDGSFEIENIVVRSTDSRQYNEVGYLGDHDNNTSNPVFFNDVTKDDINPFNVYQLLEEHEDGSITYGAIPANQNITSDRFAILPPGIIPINDGKVTIDNLGIMYLEGTVITGDGYRIIVDTLTPYELQRINQIKNKADEELTEDYLARLTHMIDRSYIWNPTDSQQRIYVVSTPYNTVQYQYHPVNESYTTHRNDDGELVATYKALPNWNTFIPLDVSKLRLSQTQWNNGTYPASYTYNSLRYTFKHWKTVVTQVKREYQLGSSEAINDNVFPLRLNDIYQIGKKTIHPKYRISPLGQFEYYTTIDHTRLLDQAELAYSAYYTSSTAKKHPNQVYTLNQQPKDRRWLSIGYNIENATKIEVDNTSREVKNLFVPYLFPTETLTGVFDNHLSTNKIIIEEIPVDEREEDDPSIYRITVEGHVIWKRNNRYYTLKSGTTYLDDTWPDIVDKDGNQIELFSVNGYFNQEPIFIRRWEDTHLTLGNEVDTLDGIQRQEKGLFRLVSRDVTLYLSDYDKSLIDNLHGHYLDKEYNETTGYIDYHLGYYLGVPYTAKDTGIHLAYHGFKPNSLLPTGVQDTSLLTIVNNGATPAKKYAKPIDAAKEYTRIFGFDKNHFSIVPYSNLWLQLYPTTVANNYYALSLVKAKQAGYNIVNLETTRKLALETNYTEAYISTDTTKYTIQPEYTKLLHDPIYLYSKLYDITIPQYVLVTEDVKYVEGRGTPGVTVIYHEHNDLETTTGETIIASNGRFRIPPPVIDDLYGYTEVYIDEPFNQKPNIHKVFWRGPNHQDGEYTKPLTLRDAESITNATNTLFGSGEYLSEIELYSPDNPITPIHVVEVDELGNWKMPVSPRLRSRKTYQLTMKTVWGTTETLEFTVGLSRLTWGDIISPMDLFGKDVYAGPVSVKVKGNSITNIESKITFDVETQQYTIHGLVGYQPNNDITAFPVIFEEGTYNFGVTPPVITAKYLHAYGVNGALLNAEPMVYENNAPYYLIDPNGVPPVITIDVESVGLTKGNWVSPNKQVTVAYRELGYLLPKTLRDTYLAYINRYTDETWLAKFPIMTKTVAIDFINQLEKYINPNVLISSYIGALQNKLYVVGSMSFTLPGISQPLYLYNEGRPGSNDRLYFTPERFFSSLTKTKPWFENPNNLLTTFTRKLITNGNVTETKQLSYFIDGKDAEFSEGIGNSILAGKGTNRVVTGRVLFKRKSDIITTSLSNYQYALNDRELFFPIDKYADNPLIVEHLEEWGEIIDLELTNVSKTTLTNKVYLDIRYAYELRQPYNEMTTKMRETVYTHWVSKGFNPNLFEFGRYANGWVEYHEDGETITIHGRIKYNGRYTDNITQTVTRPEDIQYLASCLNRYKVTSMVNGTITESNAQSRLDITDTSSRVEGVVYRQTVNEICEAETTPITVKEGDYVIKMSISNNGNYLILMLHGFDDASQVYNLDIFMDVYNDYIGLPAHVNLTKSNILEFSQVLPDTDNPGKFVYAYKLHHSSELNNITKTRILNALIANGSYQRSAPMSGNFTHAIDNPTHVKVHVDTTSPAYAERVHCGRKYHQFYAFYATLKTNGQTSTDIISPILTCPFVVTFINDASPVEQVNAISA